MLAQSLVETNRDPRQSSRGMRMSDLAFSVSGAAFCALQVALVNGSPNLHFATDLSGLLFLLIALVYRGSYGRWWGALAPFSLLFLFAPIAHWEMTGAIASTGGLLRAALVPGLSFIGGAMLITARHMRLRSIDGDAELKLLRTETRKSLAMIKELRHGLKDRLNEVGSTQVPHLEITPIEAFEVQTGQMVPAIETGSFSPIDLRQVVDGEIDLFKQMLRSRPQIQLSSHFGVAGPLDAAWPVAVRGTVQQLRVVLRSLLKQSVDSLGIGGGVIRLEVKPRLLHLDLSIEDNGRGLSEIQLLKFESDRATQVDGEMPALGLYETRRMVTQAGWRLERQARLGVGSRVILELPRVDSLRRGQGLESSTTPRQTGERQSDIRRPHELN